MRTGDVIVQMDDREVTTIEDVYDALREYKPGDRVQRDGETREVNVKLGERPAPTAGVLSDGGG